MFRIYRLVFLLTEAVLQYRPAGGDQRAWWALLSAQHPMRRVALVTLGQLLVVLSTPVPEIDEVVQACSSDADGDVDFQACFGWCLASQAADHCKWCKVRTARAPPARLHRVHTR